MNQEIKKVMNELSAVKGGSLLKNIEKLKLSDCSSVLFIGLGGLGSITINEIKKVYKEEFQHTCNIDFLAIDADCLDLREVSAENGCGCLESNEQFELYDSTMKHMLLMSPSEVKSWLCRSLSGFIDNTGTQAIRQIGRLMLCGTQKYCELRHVISNKIDALYSARGPHNHVINVVLVSGLSGGTGSGIFIDVAYMIQDILKHIPNKLWGCFYAPDVQKSIPSILINSARWAHMQSNGYAALKELDYFMSSGSYYVDAPVIYKLDIPGGIKVSSSKPIFDEGCALIISPNETNTTVKDIISKTARSLIGMHQPSVLSNLPPILPLWLNTHVGAPIDFSSATDPAGIDNTVYPAFMNYKYSTFGYNSVYFPKDEMLAYCANIALSKVIERWKHPDLLNQENVTAFANEHNVVAIEQIVGSIKNIMKEKMGYNESYLRIHKVKHSQYWPEVMGFPFLGKVRDTNKTMKYAEMLANEMFYAFFNKPAYRTIVNTIANDIINTIYSQQFISLYGPFWCKAILTGYNDIAGCCDMLNELLGKLNQAILESNNYLEQVRITMEEEAARLEADYTPKSEEIEAFITACHEYSKACIENNIYNSFIEPVILGVKEKLEEFSNKTFGNFLPVIEALTSMLNDDADVFATSECKCFAGEQNFDIDAYNLLESVEKREQFKRILGGYVNDASVNSVATKLSYSMFDFCSKDKWLQFREKPDELANEIRKVFSELFTPIVNNLLEKFLVVAYDFNASSNWDHVALDVIWNAEPNTMEASIRDRAINAAAAKIVNLLNNKDSLLMSYENGQPYINELSAVNIIMLLKDTPHLNEAIKAQLAPGTVVRLVSQDFKQIITSFKYVYPIALPLVKGIKECAQSYYNISVYASASAGMHLEEGNQNWRELLPEVYGVDAEKYYIRNMGRHDMAINYPIGCDEEPINSDKALFERIKDAYEYGVECGYIYCSETDYSVSEYKLVVIENLEESKNLIVNLQKINNESSEKIAFKELIERDENIIFDEIVITSYGNLSLAQRINECSKDGIKNIYRIIRSRMDLLKLVIDAKESYEKSGIFKDL